VLVIILITLTTHHTSFHRHTAITAAANATADIISAKVLYSLMQLLQESARQKERIPLKDNALQWRHHWQVGARQVATQAKHQKCNPCHHGGQMTTRVPFIPDQCCRDCTPVKKMGHKGV
jgi:hypothetical protein